MSLTVGLTILFVALKLFGVIAWSWIWVLSPLWIGFAVGLVCLALVMLFGVKISRPRF